MILKELKKKNYFRYFQLKLIGCEKDRDLALLFLLEVELFKIFNSTQEPILRNIKYQWLKEELNKNKSDFFLTKNINFYFINIEIKKKIIEIIDSFQFLSEKVESKAKVFEFFSCFNNTFNFILNKVSSKDYGNYKTSYAFHLTFFFYIIKNINFLKNSYFSANNTENIFEMAFLSLVFKKNKKDLNQPISKLDFILSLIKCYFKNE